MTTAQSGQTSSLVPGDLAYYLGVLRRNLLVLLCVATVVVLATALYVIRTSDTYIGRATVTIRVITVTPFEPSVRPDLLVVPATETKIATSSTLAARAAALLGKSGQEAAVGRNISASVPPKSQVLVLEYRGSSAAEAAAGANAFATAYLEQRAATAQAEQAEALRRIDQDVRALRDELRRTTENLAKQPPGSPAELDSTAYRDVLRTQLIGVRERQSAIAAMPTDPGRLVTEAKPPAGPAAPSGKQLMLGGLLVGMVLGVIAAFVRDRTNTTVRDVAELEASSGLPVLGEVTSLRRAGATGVAVLDAPRSPAARAYLDCAARVTALADGSIDSSPLLVVDVSPRHEARRVAVNLAVASARTGTGTLLVLTGPLGEVLRRALEVPDAAGFVDDPTGSGGIALTALRTAEANLSVMSAVHDDGALRDVLAASRPADLLEELSAVYECVIVAAPSIVDDLDGVLLVARHCRTLLVAERGRSKRAAVRAAVSDLGLVETTWAGAVLRRPEPARAGRITLSARSEPEPVAHRDDLLMARAGAAAAGDR